MRLVEATLYALRIPFVESFRHHAQERAASQSVVVRVRDEVGTEGFGEGSPRPYVTGETVEGTLRHLAEDLWPRVAEREVPGPLDGAALDAFIPDGDVAGIIAGHAGRAALELAVLDCALRRAGRSVGCLFAPRRRTVTYSGVIGAGPLDAAVAQARRMKVIGLAQVKVKVGFADDIARIRALRATLGPDVSLRVDANGGWSLARAGEVLDAVAECNLAAVEQPLPRGSVLELVRLKQAFGVPLLADESLVTLADADALIAAAAVDGFNVRVSKCGGLARSFAIAARAATAGLRLQVGSQVGETAILAAAGRHLAAALPAVDHVEGSFGTLLLVEDVSAESVRFGHRGAAPILTRPGIGIRVLEHRLRAYAQAVIELA